MVGEEWAREWGCWCAATRAPETPAQRYTAIPLEGWGPHTRLRPTMIRGAGPDHPWDAAAKEWLQAAPEPQAGWSGDVSSLIPAPIPPLIVLHTANVLRATEIHTWGRDAATIWWLSPEGGAARPTVAHLKTGGPVYDDALSRLGDILGPLLLMLPTDLAAPVPAARRLRPAVGRVEGSRGRQPTGPPSPGRRGRAPVGHADAPPQGAPHVYGNPPTGAPPPGVG